jgi:glutathione S-transferase
MPSTPVLWHFPVSHFNEKVRWALDFKRIPHVRKALFLDYLPRAFWATGRPTLPVLVLDGKAVGDSTRILEALEEWKPDPPLYPSNGADRRRAVELEDFFDEELGHQIRAAILGPMFLNDPDGVLRVLSLGMNLGAGTSRFMRRIFPAFSAFYRFRHHINPATVSEGPAKIRAALDRVKAERRPSGYLVGEGFSVADLTAAALFSPLVVPKEFQYPIPDPVPRDLAELRGSFSAHEAFRWVEEMYHRHRGASAEVSS